MLISDSSCACFKPSVLALAFVHFEVERFMSREVPRKSNYYSMEMFYVLAVMIELRSLCNVCNTAVLVAIIQFFFIVCRLSPRIMDCVLKWSPKS